jgi:hypothetical protein
MTHVHSHILSRSGFSLTQLPRPIATTRRSAVALLTHRIAASIVFASACWPNVAAAQASSPVSTTTAQSASTAQSTSSATRRALIICGLPGDDEHRKLFAETVEKLHKALTEKYGFAASEVLVRFGVEKQPGDGPALSGARGLSNKEGIAADVDELRKRLGPQDTFWLFVVGHTYYDGRHSNLNIPGPDLDERSFGKIFEGLKAKEQVFWITTPASGFYLKPLAAPGRIVITATEPDQEVNETLFPHALAEVLATPPEGTDRDKDGKISVLELYLAVVANVMKRYVDAENLATEHAKLDDNSDGHGSELQDSYLPPELGGRAGKVKEPTFGPKDDGTLSRSIAINPPADSKGAPAASKP